MRKLFYSTMSAILALGIAACSNNSIKTLNVSPADPGIMYMGRMLWGDSTAPAFTYPGTLAQFNFQGQKLEMLASPGAGQFMVSIDDAEPFKINFTESDSVLILADSLSTAPHSARIVYAIEGYEKHPQWRGFAISGNDPKMLEAPQRPELKIEFIGNSITCGYGVEANDPQIRFSYDTENHCLSYAYITGRNLNADVNVVARSGIGIYRYYGGPREGTDMTMPQEYDNTLLYVPDYKWDHNSFHPDIICINLGTNDTSLDNYDIDIYTERYEQFLQHLRQLHPQAKIVLLTGSMMSGKALSDVQQALDTLAAGDDAIYRFDMTPQTGELGYGADYHPSKRQQQLMAKQLTEYLNSLL